MIPDFFVHRAGRTARAGKSGKAYTFCSEQDVYNLPAIERYLGTSIPSAVAFDDMLAEDKSEGIFIRTGDYGNEEYALSKSVTDFVEGKTTLQNIFLEGKGDTR